MKKNFLFFLTAAVLGVLPLHAQVKSEPLLRVKVQSFDALTAAAKRIGGTLGMDASFDPALLIPGLLGSPELAGIARDRAWQLALALSEPGAPPVIGLFVPVTDLKAFKEGLADSSPLKGADSEHQILPAGDWAIVVLSAGPSGTLSDSAKEEFTAWAPAKAGAHLIELAVQPNDEARQQALQFLGIARMGVTQAFSGQTAPEGVPFNPQAMGELMGVYFDVIEMFLKGMERLEVRANLAKDSILISKTIQPRPDSELVRWLKSGGEGAGSLAGHLDPNATISMAGAIGDNPAFLPLLKKLTAASFKMQNAVVDEKASAELENLFDQLTPMRFTGSVDFGKEMAFWGFYEFPGARVGEAYGTIKQFFTRFMPSMSGDDKPYSSFELKEGFRKVGGVPVDRFTMAFNLDHAMFRMPGQKELVEQVWAGGKIEFEYAIKGQRLYLGTPAKMTEILSDESGKPRGAGPGTVSGNTLVGHANVLALVKQMISFNPALSAEVREKFAQINPEGGNVRFGVNVDGRLVSQAEIPLKLLEGFRTLRAAKP